MAARGFLADAGCEQSGGRAGQATVERIGGGYGVNRWRGRQPERASSR